MRSIRLMFTVNLVDRTLIHRSAIALSASSDPLATHISHTLPSQNQGQGSTRKGTKKKQPNY